jgi:hypothetical protein
MDARPSEEGVALASDRKELRNSTENDTSAHEPHRLENDAKNDDGQW